MKTSFNGKMQLLAEEGFVLAPYRDSVGVWTVYAGHTKAAGGRNPEAMFRGMPENRNIALREGLDMFAKDLLEYEDAVNEAVKVPLLQHEFDALVSFHYNTGGIYRAALTKALNAGNREKAAGAFMGWVKPKSIIGRRKREQALFRTGKYSGTPVPIYGTDGNGHIAEVVDRLSASEFQAALDEMAVPNTGQNNPRPNVAIAAVGVGLVAAFGVWWDQITNWLGGLF